MELRIFINVPGKIELQRDFGIKQNYDKYIEATKVESYSTTTLNKRMLHNTSQIMYSQQRNIDISSEILINILKYLTKN